MNEASIQVGDKDVQVGEVSITDRVVDQRAFGLHNAHERGRNWIAIVTPNRALPGGLEREFLPRIRKTFYGCSEVRAGHFIEVGADHMTMRNVRHPHRALFRVLIVGPKTWIVREVRDPLDDTLTIPPVEPEAEAASAALLAAALPPPEEPMPMSPLTG